MFSRLSWAFSDWMSQSSSWTRLMRSSMGDTGWPATAASSSASWWKENSSEFCRDQGMEAPAVEVPYVEEAVERDAGCGGRREAASVPAPPSPWCGWYDGGGGAAASHASVLGSPSRQGSEGSRERPASSTLREGFVETEPIEAPRDAPREVD